MTSRDVAENGKKVLILSKQAIVYDIIATDNFFVQQDIGLKFFGYFLWVYDNKITAWFGQIPFSIYYITLQTDDYILPKFHNFKAA